MDETSVPKQFDFSLVHTCKIHPGIGIARVGNSDSPDGYFIGPETPCAPRHVATPPGGFKDAAGRVKRQAARFRIFAYSKEGMNLGELPIEGSDDRGDGLAKVEWKVHLKNKKGAWYKFFQKGEDITKVPVRNCDIPVFDRQEPDKPSARQQLVIDPGPRCIEGHGKPRRRSKEVPESLQFDTGSFRGTKVPLGELRVDPQGRLLVLGGFGKSGSSKPDHPIGADPQDVDFWANNDYWYDDVSDGPVTATVTLPDGAKGRKITISDPADAAWVVVAPPKFAPGIHSIVTLYELIREVIRDRNRTVAAEQNWQWPQDDDNVVYYRDIYPILLRAADSAWVNNEGRRGHGYSKQGDFRKQKTGEKLKIDPSLLASDMLAMPDEAKQDHERRNGKRARARVFGRIRNPALAADPKSPQAVAQAASTFMPPLSGDGGDATKGVFATWFTILPSQYRKFERWKDGDFVTGEETFPSLEEMAPHQQVVALQRAALEPCVGGALHPGIEMSWIAKEAHLYAEAFRIDTKKHGPGDISKYMCVPWQADFYACVGNWWPAARPDDVIPETNFNEANTAWRPGQPQVAEGLEGRVKWHRGLGVTTLFRRAWNNPATAVDDPRDSDRRGCDDMVRYWSELGFVVPRTTNWKDSSSGEREIVHVETQRRPCAGMDVRELFHCLLNMEEHRDARPKVREFVDNVLAAARQVQNSTDAFAWMDNIRPFRYEEQTFEQRMKDIYDDCADFAFTRDANGINVPYDATNPEHNPYFRARENVIERIRQLTPFNFLDGSWLRNVHRLGPVDEVNAALFSIFKEELGDGVASQNHANIYRDLCHSFGFYPPPVASTAFARDPRFLDAAFDSAAFQLAISEFTTAYYPEIIGMTLWLEWTCVDLHRISQMVEKAGLSSHFYRMHIAIDNASSGHGARILRAVKIYLTKVREEGGERAVQEHWQRIWDGYVAFQHTFTILIDQVIAVIKNPPSLTKRLIHLIQQKQPYGQYNHGNRELGGTSINALFGAPLEFLKALVQTTYIVPGQPDQSRFFKALEFRGGPMYQVFTEDEVKLWRDWTLELGAKEGSPDDDGFAALKARLTSIDLARLIGDQELALWRQATSDHRLTVWLKLTSDELSAAAADSDAPDMQALRNDAAAKLRTRFQLWLGWSMIRAVTYVAAQHRTMFEDYELYLTDPIEAKTARVAVWLDDIRDAPNAAPMACSLLRGLAAVLREHGEEELFRAAAPWACALKSTIPGNDGRRARDTLQAWMRAGFPLPPHVPRERVKPLRLDSSLGEEERHPTGLSTGFGTVH
jgi:L-Lysine epsilon oxidase N-terminal/L-lysine epsilon oxidase C-terminal domain/Iron-containing redox enzyme